MAAFRGFEMSITAEIKRFESTLNDTERREVPFATAYALTKTAQDIKAAAVDEMRKVFDRPTRFALNALYIVPATKQTLVARVDFKDGFGSIPAWRFLGPQVEGGGRQWKSHEKALNRAGILNPGEFCVPARDVALDAYGNMKGGEFTRILSQLKASPDPMQNASNSKRSRARRAKVGQFFVMRGAKAPDGIYRRKGGAITPVLVFVRAPRYTKRFAFYEIARRVLHQRFRIRYAEGWQTYVSPKFMKRVA